MLCCLSHLLKSMLHAALLELQTLRDLEQHTDQQLDQLHESRKRYTAEVSCSKIYVSHAMFWCLMFAQLNPAMTDLLI